ncbi:uncharacterized protein PgNI_00099 [Pyricularia grisea]|uniref:DUF7357 domain-containing protein n=1 Tax=Pyricularia grisea TaxID=148305 RepID=A0A6P8BI80_PYRGI|nr:uncharacterized protein PgNI_00099 [Pyricularia grisea]TLD16488.1 hypothetical protein PgNI_00099 [Pyricularia grisea]
MAGTCKNIRLRLVVRRHNLPETRVLFSVSLDDDPTISQLLEQINAVIPLESDHWGLDDYALELRSGSDGAAFEALHYQHVAAILQHDEEVYIRPLLTPDLKKRRLSGRDQISTDGRHLVDGVPYGRPLLRHPQNRPSIDIPPRKRQRLLSDGQDDGTLSQLEDEDSLSEEQPPLQITQYGEPVWQGGEDDDSDFTEHDVDEDMGLDDQLSEIDEDELTALYQDNVEAELEAGARSDIQKPPSPSSLQSGEDPWYEEEDSGMTGSDIEDDHRRADELKRQLLGTLFPAFITSSAEDTPKWVHKYPKNLYSNDMSENLAILDLLACLSTAFPARPMLDLMKIMIQCEYKARRVYKRLKKDDIPHMSYNRVKRLYKAVHAAASAEAYEFLNNQMDEQQQPDKEDAPVAAPRDAGMKEASTEDDIDDEDDQSESGESVSSLVKYYDQHGFPPGSIMDGTALTHMAAAAKGGKPRKINLEDNQPAEAVDRTAPSLDSGSDSDSEEDDDFEFESDDDSDSSDDEPAGNLKPEQHMEAASDSSDSESEDEENEELATASKQALPLSESSDEDSSSDSSDDEDVQTDFKGKPRKIPTVAPDTSSSESSSEDEEAEDSSSESDDDSESSSDDSEDSSEDEGPEEVSSKPPTSDLALHHSEQPSLNQSKPPISNKPGQSTNPEANADAHEDSSILSQPGKAKTRSRNARRRALKQALKAKAESQNSTAAVEIDPLEERKKALLAALGASPEKPTCPSQSIGAAKAATLTDAEADTEEPDAWRAKINYRAVECVEEGVELSEPPFPFVQRWDPQQRGYGRGGKRKRRAASDYYQVGDVGHSATKKLKFADVSEYEEDVTFLNYDDEEDGNCGPGGNGTDGKNTRGNDPEASAVDSQFTDLDDLPSLPSDLSTLPLLKLGDAKPGMVITWKQWVLSEATSWQPQLADVSAIVASVSDDGMQLRVVLARRDRGVDRKEKTYDEETGERIYGRFEVPDADEDDEDEGQGAGEEEEDGWRTLELSELIEPRIQQRPIPSERGGSEDGHHDMQVDVPETRPNGSVVIPDSQALSHPNDRVEDRATSNEISTTVEGDGEEAGQVSGEDGNEAGSRIEETNNGPKSAGIRQPSTARSAQDESAIPETAESSLVAAHAAPGTRPEADETSMFVNDEQAGSAIEIGASTAVSQQDTKNGQQQQQDLDSPSRQLKNDVSTTVQKEGLEDGDSQHDSLWQPTRNSVQQSALVTQASHGSTSQEVCYPSLEPPTSSAACSLRSGRQPDSDHPMIGSEDDIVMDDLDDVDESQVPTPRAPQTPVKNRKGGTGSSPPSSLPSISTIWQTCPSTFGTRSPSTARLAAASISKFKAEYAVRDKKYEEEMRRLDDENDSAEDVPEYKISTPKIKESRSQQQQRHDSSPINLPKFKKESNFAHPQTYGTSVSPPAPRGLRGVRRQGSTVKSLPTEHDQVISISSDDSSPEPVYVEDYADDGIDEDYESSQPMRASYGKKYGLRGASVPATRLSGGDVASADGKTVSGRSASAMPASQPRAASKYPSLRA